jgi:hypothetical protein
MFFVKYGALLTTGNKEGSSLEVEVLSDIIGGTTTRTVADGDVILDVSIDPETSKTVGEFWIVVDGGPWIRSASNDFLYESNTPMLVVTTCSTDDIAFQSGALIVILPDGSFTAANLGSTLALIEAATA